MKTHTLFPSLSGLLLLCAGLFSSSHLYAQVNANFTANLTSGCSPLVVQFTDLSTGNVQAWFWDFGNGNTSTFDNVIATYTTPGTYTVSLTVTDTTNGLSSTRTETSYITVYADPTGDFSVDTTSGCAPLTVSFSDASTSGSGTIANWLWDFGDGNVSNGPTANPTHTYTASGTYTVTLVITDDNGCSDTRIYNDLITITDVANVDFTASPQTGCSAPLSVDFTSSVSPAGTYSYLWDFGDGNTSTATNPTHVYTTNGDYTVTLTIADAIGCQETVVKDNFVLINQPTAEFQALDVTVCSGEPVQFENLSIGADGYNWNFGDGNTSTAENPTHAYTVPGTYSVSLTATNSAGCSDFEGKTAYITVHPSPAPGFTASDNTGCQTPFFVTFTDNSVGSIVAWEWDFGNGNFSNGANPTTTYIADGSYTVSLTITTADGCQATETVPNYIFVEEPDAAFNVSNAEGCVPLTTSFFDLSTSSTDPIVSWVWNFGDGTSDNAQFPTHTYTAPGIYTVSLTVTTANGCQNTEVYQYVEAGTKPAVEFDAVPRVACVGQDIAFTDLTTGGATEWFWNFGNGVASNVQNPVIAYQDTGFYSISLVVSFQGCEDTLVKTDFIEIVGPLANFTMTPTQGCNPPLRVDFFDQSHSATSYFWDFGDGNNSTSANPTHIYNSVGTYTITMVVTDSISGCTNDIAQDITITNPLAAFSVNSTFGCAPMQVDFTNSSLNAVQYFWDFGDGNTSTAANPGHTYSQPGTYDVSLIASDGICLDTLVRNALISVSGPSIQFGADTLTGCAPLAVQFADSSTPYPSTSLVNWQWDFGDGTNGSGPNPTHTYNNPGSYDVTLTILDSQGCLDSLTKVAFIQPTFPTANFATMDSLSCPGALVQFADQSIGTGLTYLWDFGDGTTSNAANPIHLFPANGTYTISLTVTDANGCSDTRIRLNYVNIGQPTASFVADTTTATCPPLTVNFTDQSSPDVVSWYWNFGDGSTSTLPNPSKVYAVAGTYDVTLIVRNGQGCRDTMFLDDLIDISGPTGSFAFAPTTGCMPLTVNFTANSPDPSWTYEWDFGDGVGGFGTSTSHTYLSDTTATPNMIVTDAFGCRVVIPASAPITIQPLPDVSFTASATEICLGQTVTFLNTSTSDRPIIDFFWDFGDGTSSTVSNPAHTYTDTGTYYVNLLVTTLDGCTDTATTPVEITVTTPPTAFFNANPDEGCVPLPVSFVNSSFGDFPLVDYHWNFGDGNSANGSVILPHTYTNPGVYAASLTVTDTRGCEGTISRNITVHDLPPVDFSAFRYGCAPISVAFTDETLGASPAVAWLWDFGDGLTSTQQNPTHIYANDGNYTVSLTVTDANGCVNTLTRADYIQLEHPVANFTSNAGITCPPQTVNFTDLSVPDTTISWLWTFGDGSPPSTQQNPTHTYYSADTFDVTLIITNIFGCSDTIIRPQHVINYVPPTASFTVSDTAACVPENLVFTSTSTPSGAPIAGYQWDFGTGSGTTAPTTSHLYTNPGTYVSSLIITDANGCRDTAYQAIYIHPNPTADFLAGDTVGCSVTTISFTDLSSGTNAPVAWQWTFGDGNTGNAQNPVNTYFNDGSYTVSLLVTDVNGCQDSITKPNYINLDHPTAAFASSSTSTCVGTTVNFVDQSFGPANVVGWYWNFGDGGPTSSLQNPSRSFNTPGTYDVTLIITDQYGCQDTIVQPTLIEVYTDPVADFAYTPTLGCDPLTVGFTATPIAGSAPIVAYAWDFGNGNTSLISNPTALFNGAGTYDITLTVTDGNGCQDSVIQQVEVLDRPAVDFFADQTRGCAPQTINFFDNTASVNLKVSWFWDFGDGNTSNLPNPSHTYLSDGNYTVKLVVSDINGCTDSLTRPQYIQLSHPVADFSFSQTTVCPNNPIGVSFTDASIADTTLANWFWDFGDGGTSTNQHPTHVYTSSGSYSIQLIVTNVLGCSDTLIQPTTITVLNPPVPAFSMSDTANCTPLTVNFGDLSTAGDAAISNWSWDFGDGNTSLQASPTHTWTNPGPYTVVLTLTDLNGCFASDTTQVEAFELPVAEFASADTIGCSSQTVSFQDLSTSPYLITDWLWDFGDGNTSTLKNPTHTYVLDGNYEVSLTITDENGCVHNITKPDFIRLTHPVANFSLDQSLGCPGTTVQFTDLSTPDHPIVSWFWDFGDGTTSSLQNPSYTYHVPGTYSIQLMVENSLGCRDTLVQSNVLTIFQAPLASAVPGDTANCMPLVLDWESTSTPGSAALQSFAWDYGDGSSAIGVNPPAHTYQFAGVYSTNLIVTDGNGCRDTAAYNVEVFAGPQVDFTVSTTLACPDAAIQFTDLSTGPYPIVGWAWDFGDGNTSNTQHPLHAYANPGLYDINLIVTDINGCTDVVTRTQYIEITEPQAAFTSNVTALCPGDLVQFTDASIADTTIISWEWDFGDGSTSTLQNPSHFYPNTGAYDVQLIIINILGCTDTIIQTNYIDVATKPNALFSVADSAGCTPHSTGFANLSTPTTWPIASYDWEFGDGQTSGLQDPSVTYPVPGTYQVQLVVTDQNGCTDTAISTVTSFALPVAAFAGIDSIGCAPQVVNFLNTSTGAAALTQFSWDFGDGNTSTLQFPSHTYATDGIYDVSLLVVDANGCRDSLTKAQHIRLSHPTADFTVNEDEICPATVVSFADKTVPDTTIMSWFWDFGDGGTSTNQNPTHFYATAGIYDVSLTVTNVLNCSDTRTIPMMIEVLTPPSPEFAIADTQGCAPHGTTMQDLSVAGDGPIVAWEWVLGNGDTAVVQNPSGFYPNAGVYTVELTTTDVNGCSASIQHELEVFDRPVADFFSNDTLGCAEFVNFFDLTTSPHNLTAWIWDFGDGDSAFVQNPVHTYQSSGTYSVSLIVFDEWGCSDTIVKPNYIQLTRPVAAFAQDLDVVCPNSDIQFYDQSVPDHPLVSWDWDFGDGNTSNLQNPVHVYSTPGTYTVTLVITNIFGCTDTEIGEVEVLQPPLAQFNPLPVAGCDPLTVNFDEFSVSYSAPLFSWEWDFGDANTSLTQEPTHTYTTPGNYLVRLRVLDGNGCFHDTIATVEVFEVPMADFVATPQTGCAPATINFTSLATGAYALTNWEWDFGDGNTATGAIVSHTYLFDGEYDVQLIVTDANGCQDTLLRTQYIRLSHPEAEFSWDPSLSCPGLEVQFTDQSIADTTLMGWVWDFGDGTTSTQQNPSHIYTAPGQYSVSLTVTNVRNCSDAILKTNIIEVATPPVADFIPADTAGCQPLTLQFFEQNTPGSSNIATYDWDFGDGGSSNSPNPGHIFLQAGMYQVSLLITDDNGCQDSASHLVNVRELPNPAFIASDSFGCAPQTITFFDQTTGSAAIASWLWDFGDGNSATGQFVTHTYTSDGVYDVTLTITDVFGCVGTTTKPQYIRLNHPTADFSLSQTQSCPGTLIQFTDESISDTTLVAWFWDFGDGATATDQHPSHTYTDSGMYTITLIVENVFGCRDTFVQNNLIDILTGPVAQFTAPDLSGCAPFTVAFTNTSYPTASPISSWQWDFGDGTTSIFTNPSHTFQDPANYTVTLIAFDSHGCSDTVSQTVTAFESPAVQFMAAERFGCAPKQISFLDQTGQGSGLIVSWLWDFGDGTTSTQQFPAHTYAFDGVYDVSLEVVDLNGCGDSLTRPQYIHLDHPEADFSVSSNQVCPGTYLSFQDASIPDTTIVSWFWDFGDGSTSTDPNPVHAYTSGGNYTVSLTVTNVLGCSDTETKVSQVEILPAPTPFFTVADPMGCTPFSTTFTDNSIGNSSPIVSWSWAFGDGDSSTAQDPSHTFQQSEVYPVSLTVTDNNGCDATFTLSVEALSLPIANFLSVDTVDCAPHSAQFTDLSNGSAPIIGWSWNFGDGGTSSQQFPLHSYSQDGNYDVSLEVTDQNGCVGITTKPAYIRLSNPDAAIGMDTTLGCPGLLVSFTDLSNPDTTLLSWSWDFGDGTGSSVQHPTHLYQNPGLYTVSLTVTNVLGCSDTEILSQVINISTPPVAAIGIPANQGCVPFEVKFSDISTVVSSPLVSWNWDFGDGNGSNNQEPTHIYTQAGTYPISLTVTDAIGCSSTASESVTATAPPIADFAANDSMGCAPKVVIFNNFSSGAHPIVSYFWDFGDGSTSIQQTPSHLYDQDGVYTVSLTVTDLNGCTSTLIRPNYMRLSHPLADFSVDQANGCIGADFTFTDESIGDTTLVGWLWDFGDGQVSTEQNPVHSYDADGSYAVSLVITNMFGCRDTISYPNLVNIFEGPTPIIQASDTSGCTPLQITLTNQSTSPFGLIDWEWFEDGVSVGQSLAINRLYTEPGDHVIGLIVTDANGCVDSTTQLVHARPIPVANFTYSDSIGCGPAVISFNDLSAHTPNHWFWEFGDGHTSDVQNPIHTFEDDGLYSVSLTITDQYGCTDQIERINLITLDHPEASFTVDYDLSCPPIEATFAASGSGLLGIAKWQWDFGDGTIVVATQDTVVHSYADAGIYDVVLTATDSLGCTVEVDREQVIEVLANVVPDPVSIHAVSVLGDDLVEVRFAPFEGEYFQYYTIYREEAGQGFVPIHTTEYLSDTVFRDSSANARELSRCYKVTTTNFCGYESDLLASEHHCTVEATATPLPTQIVVEWNPYQGWPVAQYEIYKVDNYGPLNVSFAGVVPGNVTRFSEPFEDCFSEINYRILAIGEGTLQTSWSDTTQAAGETGVVGNPPEAVRVTVENDTFTILEWKPIDMRGLSSVRIERSIDGGDFELRASLPGGEIKFQDRDVRVDDHSYGYRLTAIDSCGNVTPPTSEQHSILLEVDKEANTNVLTWTPYHDWPVGVENYYVQIFNDTIQRWQTTIDLSGNVTRFEDKITELDQGIYCYRIMATRTGNTDIVSYSNEECIRVETSVHAPDAFTPNGDGINDVFILSGWHVASMNLQIFSRWGVKVFETNSMDEGWDGTFRGKPVEEGVYVYVARGVGNNGSVYVRRGSITLFR